MAPVRACENFYDAEAFRRFGGDVFDMRAEGEEGVESDSQDFGVFVK